MLRAVLEAATRQGLSRKHLQLIIQQHTFNCRYSHTTSAVLKGKTHYDVLGLGKDASQTEIKHAFLTLSKELHPDTNPDDPLNHEKFVKINDAYMILSKPISRKEYDMSIALQFHAQRNMYQAGPYTTGDMSGAPGSSYTGGYERGQERPFWDDTLHNMRQDKGNWNPDDPYYSVRGIKKMPNSYIVAGCIILICMGGLLYALAFVLVRKIHLEPLERKQRENLKTYHAVRARAMEKKNKVQIELLHTSLATRAAEMEAVKKRN